MPTYVVLMKLTDHGVQSIKNAPARIEETIKAFEAVGGKVKAFYAVTGGDYDFISVVEGPSDEVIIAFSLGLSTTGNIKTTSLKALSRKQFEKALKQFDMLQLLVEEISSAENLYIAAEFSEFGV